MSSTKKEVLISPFVLAKLLTVDSVEPTKESAGLLIGYLDEDGQTLVITDFDTGKQRQTSTFVVLDDEALVQIVEDLQLRGKNETIVGWAHTHPSYGCFMSGTDKSTQRTYQNLFPQAVALVVDPSKYYQSSQQKDLEIKFFRLIDEMDYKAVPYGIYFDEFTQHLSKLVEVEIKWEIPKLSEEEVTKLHRKLQTVVSPTLPEDDRELLHGFVDVLGESTDELSEVKEGTKDLLESIDKRLVNIADSINRIYNEETFNIYAVLNVVTVFIIAIAWFLIAFLT
ncbi:MAG: Mov34/MPN/PAD-1 family protein [Candidatus Heimdallarchaeaceae archaeon]|jgi:proteasome lid subunit RPN8/RPN11